MNRNLKEYNFGFAILRTFMCFMVLLYHFWDDSNATGALRFFVWAKNFAVPVFMTMTFILVQLFLFSQPLSIIAKIRCFADWKDWRFLRLGGQ